jgi:phosphotransferase system  glucose/maltose/N-acetylglucosamine-specific IIC component
MTIALFWVLFSIAVGVLASNKGRSGFGWFLLSLIVSPVLGLIFCAVSKNLALTAVENALPTGDTHLKCSQCAEFVLPEAIKCKHCGASLTPQPGYQVQRAAAKAGEDTTNLLIGLGAVVLVITVAAFISSR